MWGLDVAVACLCSIESHRVEWVQQLDVVWLEQQCRKVIAIHTYSSDWKCPFNLSYNYYNIIITTIIVVVVNVVVIT